MDTRRFWPFPIPIESQETEETRREVSFLERANQEGYKAYYDEGGVLGAMAQNEREGAMIPRSGIDRGLRRYWEVILSQHSVTAESVYVDGFENAAAAVLQWLRSGERSETHSCKERCFGQVPGLRAEVAG
jgi:hypothetical protein